MLLVSFAALKPKKEVDAALPLIPIIAGAIAAEVAGELGWKYVGKPAWKAIEKKISGKVVSNADKFDFPKSKPKKNKDGSLSYPVSKKDRAKIASLLKEVGEEIIEADIERTSKNEKGKTDGYDFGLEIEAGDASNPFYKTALNVKIVPYLENSAGYRAVDFFTKFYSIEFEPQAYENKVKITVINSIDGTSYDSFFYGGTPDDLNVILLKMLYENDDYRVISEPAAMNDYIGRDGSVTNNLYHAYLNELNKNNRIIYLAGGVSVPEDNTRVYNYPMNTPVSYDLPPSLQNVSDADIIIPNFHDDVIEAEFVEIDDSYNWTNEDIEKITNHVSTIEDSFNVENVTTNNITYHVNNYYTADDGEKSVLEVENEIQVIVGNENNNNGGGGLNTVDNPEVPKGFFASLYVMAEQVRDMYEGVTLYLSSAVKGFKDLTDGVNGLTTFLGDFFDWLPNEFRLLISSSLMLGVVAFFLRR